MNTKSLYSFRIFLGREPLTEKQSVATLDKNDKIILKMLQEDCKVSLKKIGEKTGLSSSTVHYRVNRLIEEGVITGFKASVDPLKVGKEILAISLVTGRYGPEYSKKIGEKIAKIQGVWAVYFLLGNIDFAVLLRASSREELKEIVDAFIKIEEVERSNTYLILERLKEDATVQL
jgi:Lrp/AsnC family leucine-responsive transcriptional regulator